MARIPRLSRLTGSRLGRGLLVLAVAGFALAAGVYTTGVQLENDDAFCASCHVEPETTYYRASLAPDQATTLAAFHAGVETRCIDCHSRRWIPGRLWAHWGGLQNLRTYWSGDFSQPNETIRPVGDSGCAKCHSDLSWVIERPGHYHSPWLRRDWQAANGPANTCAACHPSHEAIASKSDWFMDVGHIETRCDACHEATGKIDHSTPVAPSAELEMVPSRSQ